MKIISYNIYNGCQGDPDRLAGLTAWLAEQEADIVGLNELNGWSAEGVMQKNAGTAGYPHSTLFNTEDSVHFVGAMTRQPHEVVLQEETAFHHGLLGIKIQVITALITHLTPVSAATRRDEATALANIVTGLPGPVLLMGDLNTLSPLDRDYLEQPDQLAKLRSTPLLARKFLDSAGNIDYAPMQTLLDSGLTDLGVHQQIRYTVPTPFNQDIAHALPLRLDYMLANSACVDLHGGQSRVHTASPAGRLSDHYPLIYTTG